MPNAKSNLPIKTKRRIHARPHASREWPGCKRLACCDVRSGYTWDADKRVELWNDRVAQFHEEANAKMRNAHNENGKTL